MSYTTKSYALKEIDGKYVPSSCLDHVLTFDDDEHSSYKPEYFSFFDGSKITTENIHIFRSKVREYIDAGIFQPTDHLITRVKVGDIYFVFVSLANTTRDCLKGFPLHKRIEELKYAISNVIKNKKCIVFFSESCRGSFEGTRELKTFEVSWNELQKVLGQNPTNLIYLTECTDSDEPRPMGVSVFCTASVVVSIKDLHCKRMGKNCCGSIGVELEDGSVVWGIHSNIDFSPVSENKQYETAKEIVRTLQSHKGSIFAMGDFNTIPGNPENSVLKAIPENMILKNSKFQTFYGAFYDTVTPSDNEVWHLLS